MPLKVQVAVDNSELADKLVAHLQNFPGNLAVHPFPLDGVSGVSLQYDREGDYWFLYTPRDVINCPRRFRDAGLRLIWAEYTQDNLVYDGQSPWRGRYNPGGRFDGCSATVDSAVDATTGAIVLGMTLGASVGRLEELYAAIRCRQLRPTEWWQPKPWYLRLMFWL